MIIWDEGTAEIRRDEPGHISFVLHGRKLSGGFALTRTGERRWILVKVRDGAARPGSDIVAERPASVRSGRTWRELRPEPAQPADPWGASRAARPDGRKSRARNCIRPAGANGQLRGYSGCLRSPGKSFPRQENMTAEPIVNVT